MHIAKHRCPAKKLRIHCVHCNRGLPRNLSDGPFSRLRGQKTPLEKPKMPENGPGRPSTDLEGRSGIYIHGRPLPSSWAISGRFSKMRIACPAVSRRDFPAKDSRLQAKPLRSFRYAATSFILRSVNLAKRIHFPESVNFTLCWRGTSTKHFLSARAPAVRPPTIHGFRMRSIPILPGRGYLTIAPEDVNPLG